MAVRGVLSAALLAARTLHAESSGPILLSYDAPAECPEVAEFERQVARRSSQIHFVSQGAHERELTVRLRKVREQLSGELDLIETGGVARKRSMRFGSCAEAVEGLALIAVMSLEPEASALPSPGEPADRAPPALQTAPSQPAAAAPAPSALPRSAPANGGAKLAPHARLATRAGPDSSSRLEAALGAGAEAATEFSFPALGGTLFVDLESRSHSWFAPLVRLAVSHWQRRALSVPGSAIEAHFAFTLGTVSACPLKWEARALALRPCLNLAAGVVHSWASGGNDLRAASNPFVSWGGSLLSLVPLGGLLELYADAGLNANLIRYHFEFESRPVSSTPELYVSTSVGFRLRLR